MTAPPTKLHSSLLLTHEQAAGRTGADGKDVEAEEAAGLGAEAEDADVGPVARPAALHPHRRPALTHPHAPQLRPLLPPLAIPVRPFLPLPLEANPGDGGEGEEVVDEDEALVLGAELRPDGLHQEAPAAHAPAHVPIRVASLYREKSHGNCELGIRTKSNRVIYFASRIADRFTNTTMKRKRSIIH